MPAAELDHRGSVPAPFVHGLRLCATAVAIVLIAILGHPSSASAVKPPPSEFFGVAAVEPTQDDFKRMGRNDVGTYRMLLLWPAVEPVKGGPYDWSVPDFRMRQAVSNGMQVLPFLYGSADFAAARRESPPLGSAEARLGWRRFVAAAVERYGPGGEFWELNPSLPYMPVHAWQVWNEENADRFWHPKPSPRKYAKLLKLSSTAIRRADPNAQVVLGGMFGFPNGDNSIYARPFLKELYRIRSARKSFDGIALHPYGGELRLMKYQISRARRIMDRNGDRDAAIWITEVGWATDGPRKWPLVTTERGQAKLLKKAFSLLVKRRKRYGIRRVIWFSWRDFVDRDCDWCGSAGLLTRGGHAKPALSQFSRFASRTR